MLTFKESDVLTAGSSPATFDTGEIHAHRIYACTCNLALSSCFPRYKYDNYSLLIEVWSL